MMPRNDFNPRSHKGSDLLWMSFPQSVERFQSTLPQGERHGSFLAPPANQVNFNPRSHKGSDCAGSGSYFPSLSISIHAPTRGATVIAWQGGTLPRFQSTLPQGERQGQKAVIEAHWKFQSTLPQGERLMTVPSIHLNSGFQSTLPQGERRRKGFEVEIKIYNFNPRSHKGSDSNFTQNSISVLFHFYQSFPHIIFPHTARFRLLIIFCTFFLVRIAQGFPVCFHFAPKQYLAFYNVCSTDLL